MISQLIMRRVANIPEFGSKYLFVLFSCSREIYSYFVSNRIQHKLSLSAGHWHARVKSKNIEGWSEFSEKTTIIVHPSKFSLFLCNHI